MVWSYGVPMFSITTVLDMDHAKKKYVFGEYGKSTIPEQPVKPQNLLRTSLIH